MLDSLILELLNCSGQTLLSASAVTFSFSQRNSMLMSYCASLNNSLCSLGLAETIDFFHMLYEGW